MKNTVKYKGYVGSIEFSEKDGIFFGKVLGIKSLISYEGENAKDLLEDFHNAVDEYLDLCNKKGIKPDVAYKGSFNVRISPQLHEKIAIKALSERISLNKYVEGALKKSIM